MIMIVDIVYIFIWNKTFGRAPENDGDDAGENLLHATSLVQIINKSDCTS